MVGDSHYYVLKTAGPKDDPNVHPNDDPKDYQAQAYLGAEKDMLEENG
jgi:hypothetical protein